MKVLGIIGLLFSTIAISLGLHLHFAFARAVDVVNKEIDAAIAERGLDFLQSQEYRDLFQLVEFKTTYGMIVMLIGTLSILLCVFPAMRLFRIAWIGVVLGLITFAIGAAHSTNLFD
ncbi:MAG: hypothetical protein MK066_15265 [Crocinitomicaceae bacterium]|nr:hypothetical protein [Crocinitomicaceae bacterium]